MLLLYCSQNNQLGLHCLQQLLVAHFSKMYNSIVVNTLPLLSRTSISSDSAAPPDTDPAAASC